MTPRPVVVTRPGEPGAKLTRDLRATGLVAAWRPAFTLGPPPDEAQVWRLLDRLADYQLAVFVSVPAVEATAARLPGPWPAATAIAVVGDGTRRALLALIPSAQGARWFAPATTAPGQGGSEALWAVLERGLAGVRRAVILRAQHGREWLGDQLAAAGIEVEALAVYTREAAPPAAADALPALAPDQPGPVIVVTSSEAVDAFIARLPAGAQAAWLKAARVVAPHERIVARALAAGFADVRAASLDIEGIRQAAFAK